MLSAFYSFPYARSCGGGGGGSSSYDFMADPAVNMDMSSYYDFVSDSHGNQQAAATAQALPKSPEKGADVKALLINNSSLSHNDSSHTSLNLAKAGVGINGTVNTTLAKRVVSLGASGLQDDKTLSWTQLTLSNNLF
jgi:hypothetical protein